MDIALPAVAVAPPGPTPTGAPEAADAATDAAFAALLASLMTLQTASPVVVEMATPVAVDAAATTTTTTTTTIAGVPGPVSEAALVLAAATPTTPAPAEAVPVASTTPDADGTDVSTTIPVLGAVSDAVRPEAAPGSGDVGAEAPDHAAPKVQPERVTPQPVAPQDSEILFARAVPAAATTIAAGPVADSWAENAHETRASDTSPALAGIGDAPRTATSAPVEVAKPVAPAVAPRAAEQVVRVVAPLRAAADGTYELGLELRPDGLGRVQLDVTIERGVVHVAMRTETDAAGQLLNRSLPEMRAGLAEAGLQAGRLGVEADARGTADGRQAMPDRSEADARRHRAGRDQLPQDDRPPVAPAYADARLGGVDLLL